MRKSNNRHFLFIIGALIYIAAVVSLALPILNKSDEQKAFAIDCAQACRNGIVDLGCPEEECDDGGLCTGDDLTPCTSDFDCAGVGGTCTPRSGDGCSSTCITEFCGDSIVNNVDEVCDDGNTNDNDGCSSTCQPEVCGDGITVPIEECDDGNLNDDDGCSSECLFEPIGCLWGWPGLFNEVKPGDEEMTCLELCSSKNGYTMGVVVNTDYEFCLCTDGTEEQCSTNICDLMEGKPHTGQYCGYTSCGDGTVDAGEDCDDENRVNGDGCTDYCRTEFECGNGVWESKNGEQCDDGNLVSDDGCSASCQFEGTAYTHNAGDPIEDCDSIDPTVCLWRSAGTANVNNTVGNDNPYSPKFDTGALEWYANSCNGASIASYPLLVDLLDSGLLTMAEPLNKLIALFVDDAYAKANFYLAGKYTCLHIFEGDKYYDIYWTAFSNDDDSFSYTRRQYTPACGNEIKEAGEECDDGNILNGDGCDSVCQLEGYRFTYEGGGDVINEPLLGDYLEDGSVNIWRASTDAAFNTYNGSNYDLATASSTIGWACGTCAEATDYVDGVASLTTSYGGSCIQGGMRYITGHETCLRLNNSNIYYDVLWLSWESNQDGGFSYLRNLYDAQPPDAIIDMSVIGVGQTELSWTSVADNGGGSVQRYEVRYAQSEITDETGWDLATVIYNSIVPQSAGNSESIQFYNTLSDGTYYFAVRAIDDSGNMSDVSNSPSLTIASANKPYITGISPLTGVNDTPFTLTIDGGNFTKDVIHLIDGDGAWFLTRAVVSSATQLTVNIPAGLVPGEYSVRITNGNGFSELSADKITITEAETPLPIVTDVIPSVGIEGDSIQIIGENFTGATAAYLRYYNAPGKGLNALSNVNVVNDTLVTAEIPAGLSSDIFYVFVETPAGMNALSLQPFTVVSTVNIDETTITAQYLDRVAIADFSGFDDQPSTTLPVAVSFDNSNLTFVNTNTSITGLSFNIPAGTTLTDGAGDAYLGKLYPPRLVQKGEALNEDVYGELTDNALVFEIGNPDEPVYFDENIIVTFSIESTEAPGLVWYYNTSTGKFEPAGLTGTKDGVDFTPGGTLLSHVGDVYTIGILTNHLSPYVIGVAPSITNISPSSGVAGTVATITGTNFHPNADVTIGGMPATVTYVDTETMTAVVPGLATGSKSVVLTNPDTLFATGTFTVTAPPSGGGDEETGGTAGGGGLGNGQAIIPTSDILRPEDAANTKTSSVPSPLRETVTSEKTFTRPVEVSDEMIKALASGKIGANLTGTGGTLILKPSKDATIYLTIPQNTSVESSAEWDGKIMPPLIRSTNLAVSRTGDAIQGSENRLYRGNVAAILEVGSYTDTLEFSSPVAVTVPVSWGNGTAVDIYRKANIGDSWQFVNTVRIRNNQVMFSTDKLSLFAIARASNERREAITPSTTHAVAPSVSQVVAQVRTVFRDIQNHWAEAYITRLYNENIISGKTSGIFSPNDPVTRAELVKIALKTFMVSVPEKAVTQAFMDVDMNAWYAPYLEKAKELKIVSGFDGKIYPNQPVTRAEALKILLTAANTPITFKTTINFKDTNADAWYMWYVRYAYENGIVSGYPDGTFRPSNKVTRAEVAKMTVNVIDNLLER